MNKQKNFLRGIKIVDSERPCIEFVEKRSIEKWTFIYFLRMCDLSNTRTEKITKGTKLPGEINQ